MFRRLLTLLRLAAGSPVLIILTGTLTPAYAQNPAFQDLPVVEGTYTQVFATDTMGIGMAALSPDGRWIVFNRSTAEEEGDLFIISTSGGEPFPIETDPNYSHGAVWFPSGDRVAFLYGRYISSVEIDPATGRPLGDPQRITIEPNNAYFDISPDGKWIAYTPQGEHGTRVIRVVPSTGGIAHTVSEERTTRPAWAPDGNSIYYATGRVDSPEEVLMRIEVENGKKAEGAEPEEVLTHMGHIGTCTYPGAGYVWLGGFGTPQARRVAVTTLDGEGLSLLALEEGMQVRGFSSDGRTLLAEIHGTAEPLRVLPVAGGPPRTLQRTKSSPLSWTTDGSRVLLGTALDGAQRLFLKDVSGGPMTELRLPEPPARFGQAFMHFPPEHQPNPVLSGDGRHLLYAVSGAAPDTATLMILDVETGQATTLTTSYPVPGWSMPGRVLGPGGSVNRDEDEFFYWEKHGGELVLMASDPSGRHRVLKTFRDPEASLAVAVREDRISFVTHEGGRASIQIQEVGDGEAETILSMDGFLDVLAWSPDGRWLAATHWPGDGTGAKATLIGVAPDGTIQGEPRFLGPGSDSWWGHQWLPDSSGYLTAGTEGNVWFIPVDPMAEAVSISEEEKWLIHGFVLSPDGTQIAYAPWIPEGNSLWLVDLGDALQRISR